VGSYTVQPEQLQHGEVQLDELAEHLRAALGSLRRCAAELVDGRWRGPAGAAFRLAWEQWLDGVTLMLCSLDEIACVIGASGIGYQQTDDAVRAAMTGQPR
jgi:WXG100 family type VII secretion target